MPTYEELAAGIERELDGAGSRAVATFLDVEAVLTLGLAQQGEGFAAADGYKLLQNFDLLRPGRMDADAHLRQCAHKRCLRLSSHKNWDRQLASYLDADWDRFRFYDMDADGKLRVREHPFLGFDRRPVYLAHLDEPAGAGRNATLPVAGRSYEYFHKPEAAQAGPESGGYAAVEFSEGVVDTFERRGAFEVSDAPEHRGRRAPIEVGLDELVAAGAYADEATGSDYYERTLADARDLGLLCRVAGDAATPVDMIRLEDVVQLVGLVGAGKSVLKKCLGIACARRGEGVRIMYVEDSVAEVFELTRFFRACGVDASPLVARSSRMAHLGQEFASGSGMVLDDVAAGYLETPCLIDGYVAGRVDDGACAYGSFPCFGLKPRGNRAGGAGRRRTGSTVCPYWDVCPSTRMQREAMTAPVVVTTTAGFSDMRVGASRIATFELALADFDLVMVDEADRAQRSWDQAFAPSIDFQQIVRDSADPIARAMKRPPAEKLVDVNVEDYYDKLQVIEPAAKSLLKSVRDEHVQTWQIVRRRDIWAQPLLEDLKEQGLPEAVAADIEAHLAAGRPDEPRHIDQVIRISCNGVDDSVFDFELAMYLDAKGIELDAVLTQRLRFLLKTIYFLNYIQSLADASDFLSTKDTATQELYTFLRFSHVLQQTYLPKSPLGNLFGLRVEKDNTIHLFRQFAYGRAFIEAFPWFDTDADGKPLGPHVLLMSGSSYEPGCLAGHVNVPVDYLMKGRPWIDERLSESIVADVHTGVRVSGSGSGQRRPNMGMVVDRATEAVLDELESQPCSVLLVVNNYDEALFAAEKMAGALLGAGCGCGVCALVREKPARDTGCSCILRSDVHNFAADGARVLVAPAAAIERGFNIVDASGHAAFGSMFFLARPMPVPGDMTLRFCKLNGMLAARLDGMPEDPAEFGKEVRRCAWGAWSLLDNAACLPLTLLQQDEKSRVLVTDATATLLGTVIQVFGRLARLKDPEREAPHVYFADGAFAGPDDERPAYRALDSLSEYLRYLIRDSDQPAVARALYGPFCQAFKKGIDHDR
jgi:hypothetical protein